MIRVYVASPFKGATVEETRQNIVYARLCMLDSLERGEAPYLSHLLYTQVWAETDELRDAGLRAGDAMREACDLVALYTDLGVTPGMQRALDATPFGKSVGRNVHFRTAKALDALDTPAEWRKRLAVMSLDGFPALERP